MTEYLRNNYNLSLFFSWQGNHLVTSCEWLMPLYLHVLYIKLFKINKNKSAVGLSPHSSCSFVMSNSLWIPLTSSPHFMMFSIEVEGKWLGEDIFLQVWTAALDWPGPWYAAAILTVNLQVQEGSEFSRAWAIQQCTLKAWRRTTQWGNEAPNQKPYSAIKHNVY